MSETAFVLLMWFVLICSSIAFCYFLSQMFRQTTRRFINWFLMKDTQRKYYQK